MTGCNFGVAATGDCVVCTNEGNADMTTSMPKLHIVAMGIEKLVPASALPLRNRSAYHSLYFSFPSGSSGC